MKLFSEMSNNGIPTSSVYKRIRVPDSDSDDTNPTPVKKQTIEITTAVKERRFRNMTEMFPDVSPIVSFV